MDNFYALATGIKDAFYQMCMQLPITIDKLIAQGAVGVLQPDTVLTELYQYNPNLLRALYLLAFQSYEGFDNLLYQR